MDAGELDVALVAGQGVEEELGDHEGTDDGIAEKAVRKTKTGRKINRIMISVRIL